MRDINKLNKELHEFEIELQDIKDQIDIAQAIGKDISPLIIKKNILKDKIYIYNELKSLWENPSKYIKEKGFIRNKKFEDSLIVKTLLDGFEYKADQKELKYSIEILKNLIENLNRVNLYDLLNILVCVFNKLEPIKSKKDCENIYEPVL